MRRPNPLVWLSLAALLAGAPRSAAARNWGSVIFDLVDEGMLASAHVEDLCGVPLTYQRLRDGELLTDEESMVVERDEVDGDPVYRVEVDRYDDDAGGTVHHTVFLDRTTLRPLGVQHSEGGSRRVHELIYERDEAVLTDDGDTVGRLRIREDTVDFLTLQLMLLKFLDDDERMKFSFLSDEVLYRFYATLKESETVVLTSGTYETLHITCAMRGTWAILAPKLHFWIERDPPHRLVRSQVRREVVELVE